MKLGSVAAIGIGGLAAAALLAGAAVCLTSGCGTIAYYGQSVTGHLNLLQAARPVDIWLADPATPPAVKARLALSQRMRDFAVRELGEPDNASYRRYADLQRPAAVWNVVAAPELSLAMKTWCFAVVGCVAYRGYYDPDSPRVEAAALRAEGYETQVYPVPAYSTLGRLPAAGWLADPLLNTFIDYADADLARLIFHELAHQVAFAPGDTLFNESFASAVERIGSRRWLAANASEAARAEAEREEARRGDFRSLTLRYRGELQRLYESNAADADKREAKAAVFSRMRAEYAALKETRWAGYGGYDGWFARANNASLGVLAAYNDLVPAFERLFEREGEDFTRFYAEVRRLAALPRAERQAALAAAGPGAPAAPITTEPPGAPLAASAPSHRP